MTSIEIKHLFRNNRLPENDSSLLLFILYLPLGLVIFLLRCVLLLILMILGNVVPEFVVTQKFLNKVACLALGLSVNVENPKVRENVDVFISNSLTIFDHLAVTNVTGSISPATRTPFENILGLCSNKFGTLENLESFKKHITNFLNAKRAPVHFAPEEKPTNGKALLKFKPYPFEISSKVQPVCINVERPFLGIATSTLGSTYLSDLFFFMFSPLTSYKMRFLAPLEKKCLSDTEFADVTRQNIATALKVELTDFTSHDLNEWEKKKVLEQQQRSQARAVRSLSPDLQRMTLQVREVLPHVPFNSVYNDLYITRNVDSTITNILEGRVHFIPESPQSDRANQPSTSSSSSLKSVTPETASANSGSPGMFKTAASSFPKSASERSKSFQERKDQLIASARRRYIEKHNLDITC